jgi:hypothetical protein
MGLISQDKRHMGCKSGSHPRTCGQRAAERGARIHSFQSTVAAACRFAFRVKTSRQAQRRTSPGRRFDVRSIAVCPPSSEDVSSTAVKQTDGLRGSVEESRMQVMSGPHQISVGYTGPTCECPFLFCYSSPSLYISSP